MGRILGAASWNSPAKVAIPREFTRYMLKQDKGTEFEKNLTQLIHHPAIKERFLAFNKNVSVSDIASKKVFHLNKVELLSLYSCCFISEKESLRNFSQKISKFEHLYLTGDLSKAELYLDEIKEETGETLWFIRSKIVLLSEQEKKEDLLAFCSSLKDRAIHPIVEYIVDCLFWLSTSTQPQLTLDRFVLKVIKEYKDAGLKDYVGIMSLLFLPIDCSDDRDISEALENLQLFSIYDQYLMTLQWVEEVVAYDAFDEFTENKGIICRWLKKLSNEVTDDAIKILTERLENTNNIIFSDTINELLSLYRIGRYEDLVKIFQKKLPEITNPFSCINIVAKSMAYIDYEVDESSPLFKIVKYLLNIYSLKETAYQSLSELNSIAIQINHFRCSYSFLASIANVAPSVRDSGFIPYLNLLCFYTQKDITPLTHAIASLKNKDQERVFYLSHATHVSDINELTNYRSSKHRFIEQLRNGYYDEEELNRLSIIEPLKKDFYELKVNALIADKQSKNAVNFAAEILAGHSQAEICIPLTTLVDIIEKESLVSIDAAIICYTFSESISQVKSYLLYEVVEELLAGLEVETPSQYLQNSEELSPTEVFFYEQVCIREVIDYLACFSSSNNLALERLKVISLLDAKGINLLEKTKLETQEIINDIIVDSNVAKIGSSKVYVGVEGIKRDKAAEISALLDLYEISAVESQEEKYILLEEDYSDEITHALVTTDKNAVLVKIMETLLIPFIHDEDFGLDKNLSTEIRHGFFSNLMRSKLEDSSLILETNYLGQYIPPAYWQEQHHFLNDELKKDILAHLIWFTEAFNLLLDQAEEWMKITTDLRDKSRLFSFIITSEDLENLAEYMETTREYSDVIDYILSLFWSKTEECLENVRAHIDEKLKDSIDDLFNELIIRVSQDKGSASLIEFMDAIQRSQNGIREDIQTVSDWFHRSSGIVFEDVNLNSLIEIAVKTFRSYNARNIELNLELDTLCTQRYIQGKHVKSIVLALVNFLDNAVKYSETQKSSNVNISVKTSITSMGYTILIQNKISEDRLDFISNDDYLINQISKMKSQELTHLVRLEGGSGLKKAYYKLKAADVLFDVNLHVEGDIFNVTITYGN